MAWWPEMIRPVPIAAHINQCNAMHTFRALHTDLTQLQHPRWDGMLVSMQSYVNTECALFFQSKGVESII